MTNEQRDLVKLYIKEQWLHYDVWMSQMNDNDYEMVSNTFVFQCWLIKHHVKEIGKELKHLLKWRK